MTPNPFEAAQHHVFGDGRLVYRFAPPAQAGSGRARTRVDHLIIPERAIGPFNAVMADFNPEHTPITRDDVASSARWLQQPDHTRDGVSFMNSRARWMRALQWVVEHPQWGASVDHQEGAERLLFYFQEEPQLLPDDYPLFGLLDNAIVLNEVHVFFQGLLRDVFDFHAYCRMTNQHPDKTDPERWLADRVHGCLWKGPWQPEWITHHSPGLARVGG